MTRSEQIQWVVQRNLTGEEVLEDIRAACLLAGADFVPTDIIPFSDQLPVFPQEKKSIFYGSTTFIDILYKDRTWSQSVFYDPAVFSMNNYMQRWGTHMLNHGAFTGSLQDLVKQDLPADQVLFIRPDGDDKSFNGNTMSFAAICDWYRSLTAAADTSVTPHTPVLAGTPYNIEAEWRLWIVEGDVVAASRYRQYFRLSKERGCPMDVAGFAMGRCREYMPHDVFVMDIALCGDAYYIVECGCMNGAGFYDADISSIVNAVTAYFFRRYAINQAAV